MTRHGPSFYIDNAGPNEDVLERGLRWLSAEAKAGKGMVAVWSEKVLDNIASWSKLAPIFMSLKDSGEAMADGVKLRLFTSKDTVVTGWEGPILVIYGTQQLLDLVDAIPGGASVCYIPWSYNYADWVNAKNATRLDPS